jgi:hypothetical protein
MKVLNKHIKSRRRISYKPFEISQSSKIFVTTMVCLFSNYASASDMIGFPNEDLNDCLKRQTKKSPFTQNETCLGSWNKERCLAFLGISTDYCTCCQSVVPSSSICCQERSSQSSF